MNRSRDKGRCRRAWATTKQIVHSANSVGKEANQFDETGVDYMCKDTTAATTLS